MIALPLVRGWDAALTYGSVHAPGGPDEAPFFVGRETLLGSLVQAISQPELRGTYLVSGYRGAGKTSLVIEAARRAKPELGDFTLLTLVLNVSEVSASLDAPGNDETPQLRIDARRVITALLRSLRNEAASRGDATLTAQAQDAYDKSMAAQFTQTLQRRAEVSATRLAQRSRTLAVANALKAVSALAAAGAAVLGAAWLGASAAFPVAIAALAGVAVLSFTWATSTERKSVETDTSDRQLTLDNSLHQVETDLRDILAELHRRGFRTMFVLEELDKITDDSGEQLKDVIRYFKNLFTQAPALFFFLTDKQYFDAVDHKIASARHEGSYAVEHTFFTQRIFVTRPSLEECLDYFDKVLPDAHEAVAAIRDTQRHRVRRVTSMTPVERFLRGLLFSAQNHLFDLKAEMRGYVQVDAAGSRLVFDETALTAEEEGVAAFQFLLEQKARLYRFDGGRDYANETLRNSLSRVFADVGGDQPYPIESLYPQASGPGAQISRTERRRIVAAVDSLLAELERGGAIDRQAVTASAPPSFRWRDNAAANFSPVPELEPAERKLEATLRRAVRIAEHFDAPHFAADFTRAIEDMSTRDQPMVAEESDRQAADVNKALADLMLTPRLDHQTDLATPMEPIGRNVFALSGRIFVVYGVEEEHQRLVESYLQSANPEREPIAIVLVDDDPTPEPSARAAWRAALAGTVDPSALLVTHVSIADGAPATAEKLDFAREWRTARMLTPPPPSPVWLWPPGGTEVRYDSLAEALRVHLSGPSRQLAWDRRPGHDEVRFAFAVASAAVDQPQLDDGPAQDPAGGDVTTLRTGETAESFRQLADAIPPGDERRWQFLAAAAERRDVQALTALIQRSPESAAEWMPKLVATGDWRAVREVATAITDRERSAELLTAAAEAGDVESMARLAAMPGQPHFAEQWGDRLMARGEWQALTWAAIGVTDEATAMRWLDRAGRANHVDAMVAAMARTTDDSVAHYWEERLIASGNAEAMRQAAQQAANADRRKRLLDAADQVTS